MARPRTLNDQPATPLGQRLRALRLLRGLSQQKLAVRAGLHWQTVYRTERGLTAPSWKAMRSLADVLGVGLDYFRDE